VIISLRGTSGSGKSHVVHQILRSYESVITIEYPNEEGRKSRPRGYVCRRPGQKAPLFVPGHYEIANGGLDTLPSLDYAYDLILKHHELGMSVLYEGKNMSDGWGRVVEMKRSGLSVKVILLSTPLRECVASVRARGHQIAETSIRKVYEKCKRDAQKMAAHGLACHQMTREQTLRQVRQWLR